MQNKSIYFLLKNTGPVIQYRMRKEITGNTKLEQNYKNSNQKLPLIARIALLTSRQHLEWVQRMNNIRAFAKEIVEKEIIFE